MAFRSMYPAVRDGSAKETNPTTETVLGDTGALDAALYDIKVIVGCSLAATFVIQVRDAANTGNIGDPHIVYTAAGQSAEFVINNLSLNTDERVRVLPEANITGTAAGNVFAHRAN